jgi:hypothetical protein
LGNCDGCAEIGAKFFINTAECECCNGGSQCGGVGLPFGTADATVEGSDLIDSDNLTAKGTTYSTICWSTHQIDDAVSPFFPSDQCDQNPNWGPGNCFILDTDVTINGCGYTKLSPTSMVWVRHIEGHCTWSEAQQEYQCTQSVNEYKGGTLAPCPFTL